MRSILVLALATTALTLLPADTNAQRRPRNFTFNDCCYGNRFFLEPYGGAFKDSYDRGGDDDVGYLLGFHVGYTLTSRVRVLGNVGYSYTEDVIDPGALSSYYIYDNTWILSTAGAEFDVVPGGTAATLGLQAGVAWRKLDLDGTVGIPTSEPRSTDNYKYYEIVVPSLTIRQRISSRASLVVGLYDHIFHLLEGTAKHSPALTAGVAFR
ncbi:MAG: hypothetical protein ACRENP_01260 [Longimicrobiales bacterium]